MKVYVAEEAGFCFGVKRALSIIDRLHEKKHDVQVYGQLIHNKGVLDDLKAKGIECIDTLDQVDPGKILVIRTHGIPKEEETYLAKRGIKILDATCPLVKKLHRSIEELNSQCTRVIIVGDKNHPEIAAAKSYCPDATVIDSEEEAHRVEPGGSTGVAAQTTLDLDFFERIASILETKTGKLLIRNTICGATKARQEAVKRLAPTVDGVVVIGGKNSSNTKKLFNIAVRENQNTIHIEKSSDLYDRRMMERAAHYRSVGIAAGASTPPEEIQQVEIFFRNLSPNIEGDEPWKKPKTSRR